MRKITLTLSAAVLALAGGTGIAYAAGALDGKKGPDADGDGVVTQAEAQAHNAEMFAKFDVNGDGKLDQTDRDAMKEQRGERREARKAERFAALDADGNGEVTEAEMQAHHAEKMAERAERHTAMFAKLDTDKSGGLSQEEMQAGREMMRGEHGERGGKWGRRGHDGPGGKHGKRGHRGGPGMMMAMADTNGDKEISKAEFAAAGQKMFAAADTDNDGKVTQAERDAAREKMRAQFKARAGQPQTAPTGN